jgi:hypothetical protein
VMSGTSGNPQRTASRHAMVGAGVLVLTVLGLGACGGDDSEPPPPEGTHPPTVTLQRGSILDAFAGADSATITATVDDEDDDVLTIEWRLNPASASQLVVMGTPPLTAKWKAGYAVGEDTVTVDVSDGEAMVTRRLVYRIGTLVTADLLARAEPWVREKSPYLVRQDRTVAAGKVLEIGPGVEILFQGTLAANLLSKPLLVIRGSLQALGTGSVSDERILFTGGRDLSTTQGPDRRQHKGIRFEENGSGLLERVTVEDGEVGIENHSQGSVVLHNCRIEGNDLGYYGLDGSSVEMENTRVANNNGLGIDIDGANATLRYCTLENNEAPGLTVAVTDTVASVDVLRCNLRSNAGRNVRIENRKGFLTLTIHESNFGDDVAQVDFARCDQSGRDDCKPNCTVIDIGNNFWGFLADSGMDIQQRMLGQPLCMPDFVGWVLGEDWTNQSFSLSPP